MNPEQFNALLDQLDQEATAHLDPQQRDRVLRLRAGRRPVLFVDDEGLPCLSVPLNNQRTDFATVAYEDWLALQHIGATGLWSINDNGSGSERVIMQAPMRRKSISTSQVFVARVILGLGSGRRVRFNNHNPRDLRSRNMRSEGAARGAKYDAREVVQAGAAMRKNRAA